MEYLEPLCPAPVFSYIFKDDLGMSKFLNILLNRTTDQITKNSLLKIKQNIDDFRIPSLGILAMEMAEGFQTMKDFYQVCSKKNNLDFINYYEWTEQMAKLQILNLAIKTGYSQNDFHLHNFLVNPTYNGMYKDLDGKVIIIDFGFASKLSNENLKLIKHYYNNNEYQNALQVFETLERTDGLKISEYPLYYGWLYNHKQSFLKRIRLIKKPNEFYDNQIRELKEREEMATEDRIREFDILHKESPNEIPLLPLSNKIKNKFFQGVIDVDVDVDNEEDKN